MKSNYVMLNELISEFTPKQRGIIDWEEMKQIKTNLCLGKMNKLGLQNMRDITVLYLGVLSDEAFTSGKIAEGHRLLDIMSGITGVIDALIFGIEAMEEYN